MDDPDLKQLLDSHAELRAALMVAIRALDVKQQFGRRRRDPVVMLLRKTLREARAARAKLEKTLKP